MTVDYDLSVEAFYNQPRNELVRLIRRRDMMQKEIQLREQELEVINTRIKALRELKNKK